MKSKFPVVVPVALMLGAYILFGTFSVVHAEDVIPTPEVTPTESATLAATEPTPTESPTPEPTTSSTPDPVLTATPADDGMEMLAMSGPMLLGAAPVGPVWFTSSVGVQSYFTIAEAWGFIKGGLLPSDGIIHLDSTYGLDTDEGLDPIELYPQSTVSSTSLKGILGPSDLDPVTMKPIVRINNPFSVFGFTNGFVVSNISFVGSAGDDGVTEGELKIIDISGNVKLTNLDVQNTDSRGVGLIVETINGSIIVTNLDSSENAGGGAYLRTGTSGSITVTNSSFNNNPGVLSSDGTEIAGLVVETINSNSPVVLNGVSASGNTSPDTPGVLIKKSGTLTIKNSMFNNNLGGGLANKLDPVKPTIQGATVLDNVTASDNYQDTPDIRGGSGIELYTNGAITANNIYATGNLNYGMKLDNCNFAGAACTSTSTGAVNITNSEFLSNVENSGLDIRSRGAVTLKKVTASENLNSSAFGVKIDNTFGTAGVTITGTVGGDNQFIHNGTHGVQIDSIGNISLNYISSEENTGDGAWLVNKVGKGTVSVSNSRFYHNSSNGLYIESKGTITLLNVLSSENAGGNGVIIDNRIFATGAGFGNVTITNLTAVNNSDWGLDVLSNGTITVTGITANQNPVGGANLNNQEAILPKNVSLSKSVFDANKLGGELGPGLVVLSNGAITLTGVGTKNNGLEGILLDNPSSVGAVVINNSSNPTLYSVVGNGEEGVVITTQGAVSLTGVFADSNRIGAVINNYVVGKTPPVAISASHFNENTGGEGLNVKSTGKITLTKVSASENSSFGAKLANENATVLSAVSIVNDVLKIGSELNGFCGNGFYGLMITAKGVVTLTNVEASGNGSFGVDISNNKAANADVKISNSYFNENGELFPSDGYGLNVTSMGSISLSGGSANNNYLYGAKLDNQNGSAFPVKNITITKFEFNNNQTSFGLEAHANGTITITSVKADGNDTFGAHLDNRLDDILLKDSGLGMVVKTSSFSWNDAGIGLEILTAGSVLMDGVTANSNIGGEGIKVTSEPFPLTLKPVTVNRTSANGNSLDGLKVGAVGLVTLNGVTANGNLLFGAVLDNSSATTTNKPGITILATLGTNNFNGNRQGLTINSRGPVSLTSVTANFSTHNSGIYINNQNCSGDCPRSNVSLNKVTTRGNYGDGVYIFETNGASITLTGLTSLSNGGSGVYIHSFYDLAKISIIGGLFMGNSGYGIEVIKTSAYPLVLTGTSYFGNDTGNLFIH